MQIVRGDASRLDEVGPLFKAMHEHHRAGGAQVLPFRSGEEAWERRRPHYESLLASGRGHLLLAEEDGRVIGYAMVSRDRRPGHARHRRTDGRARDALGGWRTSAGTA